MNYKLPLASVLRTALSFLFGTGSARRCRRNMFIGESLEVRQLLSVISVKPRVNGVLTTSESRPNLEVGGELNRTYEVRNTGTEPLKISRLRDDGGNGFQTTSFSSNQFISSPDRLDIVHDAKRGLLYISTEHGVVQRYDLIQKKFISSFTVGGRPFMMDLSPNQDRLIVANTGGPWFSLIDLKTDAVSRVNLSTGSSDKISISAVFKDDSTYAYSVSSFDSIKGVPNSLSSSLNNAVLSISADRSTIGYVETGISGGGAGRYNFVNHTSGVGATGWFNFEVAVSRDGQQMAVPTYGGTYLYNANMQLLERIGVYADEGPIGVVYSPNSDIVYFAWADWKHQHAAIDAWDTKTFERVSVIDPVAGYGWTGNGTLVDGRLEISRDGEVLFATAAGGIKVYGTDDLSPIFVGGDLDKDRLLDPGEVWTYQARDIVSRGIQHHAVVVDAKTPDATPVSASADSWYRGVSYNVDYGDAPDPKYPTFDSSNGPSHRIVKGLFLGTTVDQDLDAQPSQLADADDLTSRDDDDGVDFANPLVPGTSTSITVRVASKENAWLNGWLDFNGDGDWNDTGEKFAVSVPVTSGVHALPINVPEWAVPGSAFARFRLSTTKVLDVTGPASDGEVEDYRIDIRPVAPTLHPGPSVVGLEPTFSWGTIPFASGYEVQINTRGTNPTVISRSIVDKTNFKLPAANGIGKYAIWVRALAGNNNSSGWSAIREFEVNAAPQLSLNISSTFNRRPEIKWNAVSGATTYDVYLQQENAGIRSVYKIVSGVTSLSFTPDSDLPTGLYRIWIRAVNASQFHSSWSATPSELFVGGKTRILSPDGLVSPSTPFTWMHVEGAVRYELWVKQINGAQQILRTDQIKSEAYVPEFALPKGNFKVRVRSISGSAAYSEWSDPVSFELQEQHSFLTGNNPTFDTTPALTWELFPEASSYDILIRQKSASTFTNFRQLNNIPSNSYTLSDDLPTGDYKIYFRPVVGGIPGQWQSPAAEIHVGGRTQFLSLDSKYPEAPRLSWRPVDGAVTYEVWVNVVGGASQIIHRSDLISPEFRPENALPAGQYVAWVRAIGAGEQPSPWSSPQSFQVTSERPFLSGSLPTFDRTPTWSWSGISGTSSYDLKIERLGTSGYEDLALHRGLTFLQFTPTKDLQDGDYRIRYRSVNAEGETGPWQSPPALFHVGGKTSIQQVVTSDVPLTISWRPVDGAVKSEIWVSRIDGQNNVKIKDVTIDAASEYTLPDLTIAGEYRIWIRSISSSGQMSPWSEPESIRIN